MATRDGVAPEGPVVHAIWAFSTTSTSHGAA